jgi:hypothetical protein
VIDEADRNRLVAAVQRDWEVEVQGRAFRTICAGKERGHRIADFAEERTVEIIEREGFDVAFELSGNGTRRARSMGDVWLRSGEPPILNPINVKAGIGGVGGQPNMVSLTKLTEKILAHEIDSYWLLLIRLDETDGDFHPAVRLVNILDYLDYMHFDSGPGQIMLRSDGFYAYLNNGGQPAYLGLQETVDKLLDLRRDGNRRLTINRETRLRQLEVTAWNFDASRSVEQSQIRFGT